MGFSAPDFRSTLPAVTDNGYSGHRHRRLCRRACWDGTLARAWRPLWLSCLAFLLFLRVLLVPLCGSQCSSLWFLVCSMLLRSHLRTAMVYSCVNILFDPLSLFHGPRFTLRCSVEFLLRIGRGIPSKPSHLKLEVPAALVCVSRRFCSLPNDKEMALSLPVTERPTDCKAR